MSDLIIVESPTKARTLTRFLGSKYTIHATMGHVRDLPEKRFGIKIVPVGKTHEFIPQYQVISGRREKLKEIKAAAFKAKNIILATDPDREGEAIAFHIKAILSKEKITSFQRIVFHEITENAIFDALKNPRTLDLKMVDAQQGRRILDRIVGYKLSPVLWYKLGKKWLSAGRVQTVALRLIVEKEREIKAFIPIEYWIVDALLVNNEKIAFTGRLTYKDGKKVEVKNKEEADKILNDLNNAKYIVENIEKKESRRFSSPPFTTSTMQQSASVKYGWSARRTMKTAQTLYEEGYITYHRTDSTNLAMEAINGARTFINKVFGGNYLPPEPKFYKTKSKVAQEAHEAIRPTDIYMVTLHDKEKIDSLGKTDGLKAMGEALGRDAQLLYSLIYKRFLSCQMNEAVMDQTIVTIDGSGYKFIARGQTMKFAGWMSLYPVAEKENIDGEEANDNAKNKTLPALNINEEVVLDKLLPQQKFTTPPDRFTEAGLIKSLEEKGIGRPSTYAPIISTIQDRKYVEKIEKKFIPTDLGFAVCDFLVQHFPDVFNIGFTALMENDLDEIANGNKEWMKVVAQFFDPLIIKIDEVYKTAERVKIDLGTTDEKCPKCEGPMAIRISKYGKFLACSNYPTCKFTKNIIEKAGILCPKCGGDMVVKKTRRGKQFYGCGNYPKCTFAAWKKEDIK